MAFKLPLDAWVLMVPVAYGSVACAVLVARTFTSDPESHNVSFYDDEKASAKQAQAHDNTFKRFFEARIKNHKVGVFQNWFEGSPQ